MNLHSEPEARNPRPQTESQPYIRIPKAVSGNGEIRAAGRRTLTLLPAPRMLLQQLRRYHEGLHCYSSQQRFQFCCVTFHSRPFVSVGEKQRGCAS